MIPVMMSVRSVTVQRRPAAAIEGKPAHFAVLVFSGVELAFACLTLERTFGNETLLRDMKKGRDRKVAP